MLLGKKKLLSSTFIIGTYLLSLAIPGIAQDALPSIPSRLTLADAENLLLQRNLAVIAARYQVEASRAARLIASYKPNPVLTVGAEQFPIYSPLHDMPRFFKTNSDAGAQPTYTLRFDKIVERGGKREFRTEQADFQVKTSEAQMLDAIRTQVFQLRQAFNNAILARQNAVLAETTQQQYEQTEKLTQIKLENGDLPALELYRVRAGKLQFQQAVLQAQAAYDQAARDILNLLGARAEQVTSGPIAQNTSLGSDPQAGGSPGSLRNAVLEVVGTFDTRPLLQSVSELRDIALAERPDVIAARIAQADAQRRAAEAQLRQVEFQALTDVEKAYRAYESARRVMDLYNSENLAQVEKLRTISNISFKEGAASLFEVLDAQRTYNQSMVAYNQAKSDYQLSLWQLEQATARQLRLGTNTAQR